jgi:hypothetical protein
MSAKTFHLDLVTLPPVKRKNINGKRYYYQADCPELVYYPSVTGVVGSCKKTKKAIYEWRNRVGEVEANKISRLAAARGTSTHTLIEKYIKADDDFDQALEDASPLGKFLFSPLRKWADNNLGVVRCIEGQLFSHHLRCAGTVDMVAEVGGLMSVVDWKTSTRMKRADKIDSYYKQEAAYAVMFEENTGIPVSQLVTVMVSEDGEFDVFFAKRDDWIDKFIQLREEMGDVSVHL